MGHFECGVTVWERPKRLAHTGSRGQGNPASLISVQRERHISRPATWMVVAAAISRSGATNRRMRRLLQLIPLLMIVIGAMVLFQRPAYGYTDPGTGLLAIQAAGSAVVAVGWYLRRKIFSLFHRSPSGGKEARATYSNSDEGEETRRS
jgi:hypothetical protein